jgi:hypothetical protein
LRLEAVERLPDPFFAVRRQCGGAPLGLDRGLHALQHVPEFGDGGLHLGILVGGFIGAMTNSGRDSPFTGSPELVFLPRLHG